MYLNCNQIEKIYYGSKWCHHKRAKNIKVAVSQYLWCVTSNLCYIQYRKPCNYGLWDPSNRSDLTEVYEMKHHFTDVAVSSFFCLITTDRSTRGHNLKLVKSHCNTDSRLYFFSSRVVNRWNSVINAGDCWSTVRVSTFKRHLDSLHDRFFHGLYVCITLLAADFDMWLDTTILETEAFLLPDPECGTFYLYVLPHELRQDNKHHSFGQFRRKLKSHLFV